MKNLRYLFGILGLMVVVVTGCGDGCPIDTGSLLPGACVTESGPEIRQGNGIPWTFNVTNQSGNAIMVKVTPLRSSKDGQSLNDDPPAIVDGPIVETSVAQSVSESIVIKTGTSFGVLGSSLDLHRSFTFEISGLNAGAIVSFGWPVEGVRDTTTQYYGLGYVYGFGLYSYVSPNQLFSSLVPSHYLSSDPIYNVIVENPNSIKWSLDEKVKLDEAPPPPPS